MKRFILFLVCLFLINTIANATEVRCSATCIGVDNKDEFLEAEPIEVYGDTDIKAYHKLSAECRLLNFVDKRVSQRFLVTEFILGSKRIKNSDPSKEDIVIPGLFVLKMTEANVENCQY